MRYLRGIANLGLVYRKCPRSNSFMNGLVNANFAGDLDKKWSQTWYVFTVLGIPISWKATLQHVIALSTIESKYIALTKVINEALWMEILHLMAVASSSYALNLEGLGRILTCQHYPFLSCLMASLL